MIETADAAFALVDDALRTGGAAASLDALIAALKGRDEPRALLDALLLKARHDLGLPLVPVESLSGLDEPLRGQYERRYVEALREVGGRLLDAGRIPQAWPYFRLLGEPEAVARAIDEYKPADGEDPETLGQIIEVAFSQQANPVRGFELILDHHGPCSAISAFEHLPPGEAARRPCAERLIRRLHEQLVASLREEVRRRGQPLPAEGAPVAVPELIAGRDWLFQDEGYHIDVSHLAAVVRVAPLATDPEALRLAAELCEYGRHLSSRHRYEGESPFEDTYADHAIYLRGLLGDDAEGAVAHFSAKLPPPDPDGPGDLAQTLPAQHLIRLLVRLGREEEAIAVAADHLAGVPESALFVPSLPQLCERAGRPGRLADVARDHGDLVNYTAARLREAQAGAP